MKENPIRSLPGIPFLLGVLLVAAFSVWLFATGIGPDPKYSGVSSGLRILGADVERSDPHRNPDARLIETVPVIDAHILSLAGDKGSALATGGMVTKLHAAQIATAAGCEMVIANGEKPEVLYDIVAGRRAGTRFLIPHS